MGTSDSCEMAQVCCSAQSHAHLQVDVHAWLG